MSRFMDVRKRRKRRARLSKANVVLSADDRHGLGGGPVVKLNLPEGEYERIFGHTERAPSVDHVWDAERKCWVPKAQSQPGARGAASAPAVHGENKGAGRRLYKPGTFDWGLGERISGRSDRRRKMERAGLRERI